MKYLIKDGKVIKNLSKFKLVIFIFILFIFMPIFLTFIHEIGHLIIALIFKWDILSFHISYFPFILDLSQFSGYIIAEIPFNANNFQLILFHSFGSIFSLIIGSFFMALFYNFKFNIYIETFFYLYSIAFILDLIVYIILDIFFLNIGDWFSIYIYSKQFVGILLIFSIIYVFILILIRKKILERYDI